MLIRVNAATAVPTVRQFAGDLLTWVREGQAGGSTTDLAGMVSSLQAYCDDRTLEVEVVADDSDAGSLDRLATAIGGGVGIEALRSAAAGGGAIEVPNGPERPSLRLVFQTGGTPRAWPVGRPAPPVLLLDRRVDARESAHERPVVLVLGDSAAQHGPLRSAAWYVEALTGTDGPGLAERLASSPVGAAADILRASAAAEALDGLCAAFALYLEQEDRALRVKRALAQERAGKTQQRGITGSASDLVGDLRQRVQRQFSELERGLNERAQLAFTPGSGVLWRDAEERLASLTELNRVPLTRVDRLTVPPAFRDGLVEHLRLRIAAHYQQDLQQMNEMYRIVTRDVEQGLTVARAPAVLLTFDAMRDGMIERILDSSVVFQKEYAGEIPRKGFYEYAMAARRYQMLLFLLFSSFGLSFLRNLREFMIPMSILVLSFGAYRIAISVAKERVESTERELQKAREALRSEIRRILSDTQRTWTSAVGQHLQLQVPLALGNAESTLRDYSSRRTSEAADEKQRLQRQLQGIENSERKHQTVGRGRDAVAKAVAQLRGELKQLAISTLRPPVPRKAAP